MKFFRGILLPSMFLMLTAAINPGLAETPIPDVTPKETEYLTVTIADPFVELHTGPGGGYPIYHIIERGEEVQIIRRKTDWFKIVGPKGKTGWASRAQMQQTLLPSGEKLQITDASLEDFTDRRWVFGVTGGEFEGAPVFTVFTAYSFTDNLAVEGHFGKSVGSVSSAEFYKGNVIMQPFADLKYSPYMTLGIGQIKVDPSATFISGGSSETNELAQFGLGVQRYISRSFLLRFEVNEYIIFSANSTSNDNEEIDEWKFGFAVFF